MAEPARPFAPLDALAGASFCRVANAKQFDGNAVRILRDGAENYPAWLAAIAGARSFVHLENYLFREEPIGHAFADALKAAARRGVACRVIYDWLGCVGRASPAFWADLRAAGVEVRCHNPPRPGNPLLWVSRDHRKLLVVDGRVAFAGGLCIGQNWIGYPDRGVPAWRDTALEIIGPAAAGLDLTFADSWNGLGAAMPAEAMAVDASSVGEIRLWVVAGVPDDMGLYRLERLVAEIVERSLWLADGYFVATTDYVRALTTAARAGVDVRLLVPSAGDLPLVTAISRSAYRALLEGGVRVFEWNGPMMHAKTAVADGRWSRVGSSNSNLASWLANRELDVTIHDRGLAAEMERRYLEDLENACELVLLRGRPRLLTDAAKRPVGRRGSGAGVDSRLFAGLIGFGGTIAAALGRRRALGPSETRIILLAGVVLLVLAGLVTVWPRWVAYPVGVMIAWVGVALLIHGARLRLARPRKTREPGP